MKNLWSDAAAGAAVREHAGAAAPGHSGSAVGELAGGAGEAVALRLYTCRLLGSDPSLVLHGGGNVSLKAEVSDLHGRAQRALFVKASGHDMATLTAEGLPGLDLARLEALASLPALDDPAMSAQLLASRIDARAAAPSIETLVHAFLPAPYIDHTHADAILALGNQANGAAVVREALGKDVIVLPYLAPGFALAKAAAAALTAAPGARAMVWLYHGLLTWGATARESYESTIAMVTRAEEYLDRKAIVSVGIQAGPDPAALRARALMAAPVLRGLLSARTGDPDRPRAGLVLERLADEDLLAQLERPGAREIALTSPLTTDHLIRTKALPMWVDRPAWNDSGALQAQIADGVRAYEQAYEEYVGRHRAAIPSGLAPFEAAPRVVFLPGLGALCAGGTERAARTALDITRHTMRVKARIAAMGTIAGPTEAELFHMEYRPQQHDKLRPAGAGGGADAIRPLEGRIALVTGAAGAIGSGLCKELLAQGALVAATDLPGAALEDLTRELDALHPNRVLGAPLDVTDAASVRGGFERAVLAWGGIDLVVVNAGLAHVAPLAELAIEDFRRLERVNVEGTLHLLAEASRWFALQGIGGDIVLISSKNVASPGAGFGAYSATKAAAHQLARIASLELAPLDVRVNMVAPDAVFSEGDRKSGLWAAVGPDRMRARGLEAAGLEEYYRNRNLLKARITARHVARAVLFFATRQAPITGCTLPVDGGLPEATPR